MERVDGTNYLAILTSHGETGTEITQHILKGQEDSKKLVLIKQELLQEQNNIQDDVKQKDEWACSLDDFIDILKKIINEDAVNKK